MVIVGVCAMEKKTQSKPMKEILTRLQEFEYIKVIVFQEDVILHVNILFYFFCLYNSLKLYALHQIILFFCRNLWKSGQFVTV